MVVLTPEDRRRRAEVAHSSGSGGDVEDHALSSQVAIAQGVGYAVTGLWPLLHMRSFVAVTGPKTDLWLVRTVGVLVKIIGCVIAAAGISRRLTPELRALAAASSAGLAMVDAIYAVRGRISKVYLLDAIAELPLTWFWVRSFTASESEAERLDDHAPAVAP
jgi:hypothetical protein